MFVITSSTVNPAGGATVSPRTSPYAAASIGELARPLDKRPSDSFMQMVPQTPDNHIREK